MSDATDRKTERKKIIAAAQERGGKFEVTTFGRLRTRTKVASVGAVLLALCAPAIYLYRRLWHRPA